MTNKPIQIKSADLSTFISLKKACVIQATIGIETEFNSTLLTSLRIYLKLPFSIGAADSEQLDYNDAFVQNLISKEMLRIGLMASDTMLPGYYLFKKGTLAAYHPGTFDVSKLDAEMVKTTMKIAVGVSFATGLFTNSFATGLQMFVKFSEVSTGMNIFEFFKEVLEAKSDVDIFKKQQSIIRSELDKAYALLKISVTATNAEVKAAYYKIIKEHHPDLNPGNKEVSDRMAKKVIEAYRFIMAERKASKVEV